MSAAAITPSDQTGAPKPTAIGWKVVNATMPAVCTVAMIAIVQPSDPWRSTRRVALAPVRRNVSRRSPRGGPTSRQPTAAMRAKGG